MHIGNAHVLNLSACSVLAVKTARRSAPLCWQSQYIQQPSMRLLRLRRILYCGAFLLTLAVCWLSLWLCACLHCVQKMGGRDAMASLPFRSLTFLCFIFFFLVALYVDFFLVYS